MSEINSPLGKKTFNTQGRKILSVSDESEDFDTKPLPQSYMPPQMQQQPQEVKLTPEQFNAMQARKNEIRMAQKRPSSEARQRIEVLTGIGRLTIDTTIEGYKFTLQSLKSREMREIIKVVAQIETPADAMYEMRAQTLARSLVKIDDQPVELVLGVDGIDGVVEFINDSEEHIVNKLYSAYTDMTKANENKFSVADAKDAQEVTEEIKK